jgi:hypothetical protein
MKLSSLLYRLARTSRDVEAFEKTGNLTYVARRAGNKLVDRALARVGFWGKLWGGPR